MGTLPDGRDASAYERAVQWIAERDATAEAESLELCIRLVADVHGRHVEAVALDVIVHRERALHDDAERS